MTQTTPNLPIRHPSEYADPLKARTQREAIAVSQWRNSQAIVIGDKEKEEWIVAPNAYRLDMMR